MPTNENSNPYGDSVKSMGAVGTITSAQLGDPSLRGLIKEDLKTRSSRGGMVLPDYEAMKNEELAKTRESLSAFSEAERLRALPEIEKSMQKRGMLSSGSTTERQLQETEATRLETLGQYSAAEEAILARYAGYGETARENELNRQNTLTGIGMQTASTERIATLNDTLQRDLATVNDRLQRDLAAIEASTTLSVEEKRAETERLQIGAQKEIAQLNSATSIETTRLQTEAQLEAQRLSTQSAETVAKWSITSDEKKLYESLQSSEKIAFAQMDAETQRTYLTLSSNEKVAFANLSSEERIAFATLASEEKKVYLNLESAEKIEFAKLSSEWKMFDVSSKNDMEKFSKSLTQAETQFNLSESNKMKIASDQINEQIREFDLSSANDLTKLKATLDNAVNLKLMDNDTAKQLQENELKARLNEFDLSRMDSLEQFAKTYQLQVDTLEMTKTEKEAYTKLAQDKFTEEIRQYNITTTESTTEFWATNELAVATLAADKEDKLRMYQLAVDQFGESQRQFNISKTEETKQFWANYEATQSQLKKDNDFKEYSQQLEKSQLELYGKQFALGAEQWRLTREDGIRQATERLEWEKTQSWANDTLQRDLQNAVLTEQRRQFNVTNLSDLTKFVASSQMAIEQFNVTTKEQHDYAAETLKLKAAEINDSDLANYMNFSASLLNSPVILSLDDTITDSEGQTELSRFVGNVFSQLDALDGDTTASGLSFPSEITKVSVDNLLNAVLSGKILTLDDLKSVA